MPERMPDQHTVRALAEVATGISGLENVLRGGLSWGVDSGCIVQRPFASSAELVSVNAEEH